MTKAELIKLEPYFREGERRLNGQPVQWDSAVYRTARWLVVLRELLDSPCGSSVSRMGIGRRHRRLCSWCHAGAGVPGVDPAWWRVLRRLQRWILPHRHPGV